MGLLSRFSDAWLALTGADEVKVTLRPSAEAPQPRNRTRAVARAGNGGLESIITTKLPSSKLDWAKEAGDLGLNSIIAMGLDWYIRNLNVGKLVIQRNVQDTKSDKFELIDTHPLLNLLRNPSPGVPANTFYGWITQDLKLQGNAYARKVRKGGRRSEVVYLQFLPCDMVTPKGEPELIVKEYIYMVDGVQYDIASEDIIHWRYLRDPMDIRVGRSTIASVLKEVAADNQSSTVSYSLLKNNAMPSLMVGPASGDMMVEIMEEDARVLKKRLQEDFCGDNAGGIAVSTAPYSISRMSMSPAELSLDELRRKPEERIASALGLNCMVLGLGAGLERNTYSNYAEARRAAWEDGMVPLQEQLCAQITMAMIPEYTDLQEDDIVAFDNTEVPALQEDESLRVSRATTLYAAGIIDKAEARKMIGEVARTEDEGINSQTGVGVEASAIPAEAPPEPAVQPEPPTTPPTPQPEQKATEVELEEVKAEGYKPTSGMQSAARRALQWKKEGKSGGTLIGLTRANQLVNGESLSESTVLRMYSFFSRHEVDKQATGFNSGQDGFPSNGRVAWDLWGGDAGASWSKKIRDRIMKEREGK